MIDYEEMRQSRSFSSRIVGLRRYAAAARTLVLLVIVVLMVSSGTVAAGTHSSFCQGSTQDAVRGRDAPAGKVSLLLKSDRVKRTQVVSARIVNLSDKPASYGLAYVIERFASSAWILDPSTPDGPWPKALGRLGPSVAGRCFRFRVPEAQDLGQYRFVVYVHINGVKSQRAAEYMVVG